MCFSTLLGRAGEGCHVEGEMMQQQTQLFAARLRRAGEGARHVAAVSVCCTAGWLVTGGFGGLGLRAAVLLDDLGSMDITVCSRRGTVLNNLAPPMLCGMNRTSISAVSCDIAQHHELMSTFKRGSCNLSVGVLQGAGVLDDAMLCNSSLMKAVHVFAPKASGAWSLQVASWQLQLQSLILFSSVASVFGNLGQTLYAAANAYLDALARNRLAHSLVAFSLQLPLIANSGFAQKLFRNKYGQGRGY